MADASMELARGPEAIEEDDESEEHHLTILLKQNAELLYQLGHDDKKSLEETEREVEAVKGQIESKKRELKNAQKKDMQYQKANANLKKKLEEISSSNPAAALQKAVHDKQRRITCKDVGRCAIRRLSRHVDRYRCGHL